MITIPFHNIVVVPGAVFYFQSQYFQEVSGGGAGVGDEVLFLMLHEDKKREEMTPEDFYPIGAVGVITDINRDGDVEIRIGKRVNILRLSVEENQILYELSDRPESEDMEEADLEKRLNDMKAAFLQYVSGHQFAIMARTYVMQWKSLEEVISSLSSQLTITNEEKYAILAADTRSERTLLEENALYEFLEIAKVMGEAQTAQTESNEKLYREDAIKKQISFLQKELDEMHPENVSDVRRFEKAIESCGMNETAKAEAEKVLNRMKQEGQHSNEYGLLYDYLDFVTGLAWGSAKAPEVDLKEAEAILDEDHYGLKKVKTRVLQQIAVMSLNRKQSGSILLFVGAPGTGKTSIGQSIARALGRKYMRVSLGGIRDEAEIRGHRRTYIGAMPGRIMDAVKKSGVSNPVIVLDEVDKLSHDYHGDPASALLEVLDPEQNSTFTDHYMNVPYDLSDVLFLCTANAVDTIPEPLLNRMEVIDFPGYTQTDKVQIARKHLLPKAMEAMGLKKSKLRVPDEAIEKIISDYTMESGVRGLKKRLDGICRAAAVKLVRGDQKSITISVKKLPEFLDAKPIRHDHIGKTAMPGVVTGLAWTRAGGEILFVETVFTRGKGKIIITGQLGDVMKESVSIAVSLVKAKFPEAAAKFEENDLHVHVPEGAVPKDGPSAGITLTTAIASLVTGTAVDPASAMTGEVSLRGLVLPIGGLPEKLMAAVRAGVKTVYLPQENMNDLGDVPTEVIKQLTITPVHTVEEVFSAFLIG